MSGRGRPRTVDKRREGDLALWRRRRSLIERQLGGFPKWFTPSRPGPEYSHAFREMSAVWAHASANGDWMTAGQAADAIGLLERSGRSRSAETRGSRSSNAPKRLRAVDIHDGVVYPAMPYMSTLINSGVPPMEAYRLTALNVLVFEEALHTLANAEGFARRMWKLHRNSVRAKTQILVRNARLDLKDYFDTMLERIIATREELE